jgi:hypothetical protein
MEKYNPEILEHKERLSELFAARGFTFNNILKNKPSQFNVKGVYAISTPNDGEVVYVGKTLTKSVIGRLSDHRSICTTSDLKGMLKLFPNYPQEINNYVVRCIQIDDPRRRTFVEYFIISAIQPAFNK